MWIPASSRDAAGQFLPCRRRSGRRLFIAMVASVAAMCYLAPAAWASGFVYWSDGNAIGRAGVSGDRAHFITGAAGAAMVAVTSHYIYWANTFTGTIGRAKLNGTDVDQRFIPGAHAPVGVAVGSSYIYWANNATGTIGRARLNDTGVNQRFITTAQPHGPDAVVLGSGHIYWANDYNIGRANIDGTGVNQRFIAVPNGPKGVAGLGINSRYIYWTNETADTIGRANLNGTGVSQRFITDASNPDALATDSRYVYWANWGNGTLGRANLSGTHRVRFLVVKGTRAGSRCPLMANETRG